jgi:RHS repeat-associated protein
MLDTIPRYLFNAKELDEESGLYYYEARYYSDENIMFTARDPLFEKYPFMSPYAYCNNNPVNLTDSDGRAPGPPNRRDFYNTMGTSAIQATVNAGASNKFKGLYIIAQRRVENGFNSTPPGNNPMNLKGSGDMGQFSTLTTEYVNGVATRVTQNFAKYSSVEKGFGAYMNLLQNKYSDSYDALIDGNKTIADFASGLKRYATSPSYIQDVTSMFNGVVNDYKKMLNDDLQNNNNLIERYQSDIDKLHDMGKPDTDATIMHRLRKIGDLKMKNKEIENDIQLLNDLR